MSNFVKVSSYLMAATALFTSVVPVYATSAEMPITETTLTNSQPTSPTLPIEDTTELAQQSDNSPSPKYIRISRRLIAFFLQAINYGTQMRLHHGESYYRLGYLLGRKKTTFNIPRKKIRLGFMSIRLYVNDINLERISIRPQGDGLRATLFFESEGKEIRVRNGPDVHIDNARLDIDVEPDINSLGQLTYKLVDVKFSGNVRDRGLCKIISCKKLFGYKSTIASSVEEIVRSLLDNTQMRNELATLLAKYLQKSGVNKITSISLEGSHWVIESQ